jgi:glutamate-1-semialdehyde 2,1-aminomutase
MRFRNSEHANLDEIVPGGAHTYSRGDDQFPINAPRYLLKGRGAKVWDQNNSKYWDLSMGLRSVSIGHGNFSQSLRIFFGSVRGVNLSRPVLEELELATLLRSLIPSAEMVKFGKNGSDATSGAIRISRAVTNKSYILRSKDSAFLSVSDWFIGSTEMNAGVTSFDKELTKNFKYGSITEIVKLYEKLSGDVAAIILEPYGINGIDAEFLRNLREFCDNTGVILIFDEVVSGFRFALGGIQDIVKVTPDLSTFGKSMANGYPLSALVGKAEIMQRGGINHEAERVFLMSSTYGSERSGLIAGIWTINKMIKDKIIFENSLVAEEFKKLINASFEKFNLNDELNLTGLSLLPSLNYTGRFLEDLPRAKAAFSYACIENGLLMPYISFSASHRKDFITFIGQNIDVITKRFLEIWDNKEMMVGSIKPVFRKFN